MAERLVWRLAVVPQGTSGNNYFYITGTAGAFLTLNNPGTTKTFTLSDGAGGICLHWVLMKPVWA
jgi:hypothetical protein